MNESPKIVSCTYVDHCDDKEDPCGEEGDELGQQKQEGKPLRPQIGGPSDGGDDPTEAASKSPQLLTRNSSSSATSTGSVSVEPVVTFPVKLHDLLSRVDKHGLNHIISWAPHGRCFLIHKKEVFTKYILPKWFRQTQYTSFQRQLNIYHFKRITNGPDKGAYYHELFLRGRLFLCHKMQRMQVKGCRSKGRHKAEVEAEPDFYAMKPCLQEDDSTDGMVQPSSSTTAVAPGPTQVPVDPISIAAAAAAAANESDKASINNNSGNKRAAAIMLKSASTDKSTSTPNNITQSQQQPQPQQHLGIPPFVFSNNNMVMPSGNGDPRALLQLQMLLQSNMNNSAMMPQTIQPAIQNGLQGTSNNPASSTMPGSSWPPVSSSNMVSMANAGAPQGNAFGGNAHVNPLFQQQQQQQQQQQNLNHQQVNIFALTPQAQNSSAGTFPTQPVQGNSLLPQLNLTVACSQQPEQLRSQLNQPTSIQQQQQQQLLQLQQQQQPQQQPNQQQQTQLQQLAQGFGSCSTLNWDHLRPCTATASQHNKQESDITASSTGVKRSAATAVVSEPGSEKGTIFNAGSNPSAPPLGNTESGGGFSLDSIYDKSHHSRRDSNNNNSVAALLSGNNRAGNESSSMQPGERKSLLQSLEDLSKSIQVQSYFESSYKDDSAVDTETSGFNSGPSDSTMGGPSTIVSQSNSQHVDCNKSSSDCRPKKRQRKWANVLGRNDAVGRVEIDEPAISLSDLEPRPFQEDN